MNANSKYELLKKVEDGHILRWIKQLGMRGNARNIVDGVCGKQKLIITGDFDRFIRNKDMMFPGAKIDVDKASIGTSGKLIGAAAVARLLMTTDGAEVTSKDVKALTGVDMSKHGKRILADVTLMGVMRERGWTWVPGKGGKGHVSSFRR
jgi:hypothetical protein